MLTGAKLYKGPKPYDLVWIFCEIQSDLSRIWRSMDTSDANLTKFYKTYGCIPFDLVFSNSAQPSSPWDGVPCSRSSVMSDFLAIGVLADGGTIATDAVVLGPPTGDTGSWVSAACGEDALASKGSGEADREDDGDMSWNEINCLNKSDQTRLGSS